MIRINLAPKLSWYRREIARIDKLKVSANTRFLLHVAAQLEEFRRQNGCLDYESLFAALLAS